MSEMEDLFGEVIHSYSRKEAIEDGVLVDVSEVAKEAGIKFPMALTAAVFTKYVKVPPGMKCQDESGRLWDVVWMTKVAIMASKGTGSVVVVKLHVRTGPGGPKPVTLKAVCGPGDSAEPVITVMLPEED